MRDAIKEPTNAFYKLVHTSCHHLMKLFFEVNVIGKENIPKTGSFIVAPNHNSFLDPPLAGSFIERRLYYFARSTLFEIPFVKTMIRNLYAIPIDREGGQDLKAFREAFKVFKEGNGFLIFPEGTRSDTDELLPANKGVGMIACKAQVPVIPTRIFGSRHAWGREAKFPRLGKKITIVYNPPLYPEDYDRGKQHPSRYQEAADRIVEALRSTPNPETDHQL